MSETNSDITEDTADEQDIEDMLDGDIEADSVNAEGEAGGLLSFIGDGGIKEMLLQEDYQDPETGHTYSQAHLVADIINVMRMDAKQMAALHDIDVNVEKMSAERAATLLQEVATGDGLGIIEVFQNIEDDMDLVFQQKFTEEQHEAYMEFKENMLYTTPGGENDE